MMPWDADRRRIESIRVGAVELARGDRVRLRPRHRADIMDIVLQGKVASIESIEEDFEGRVHVAVTVEEDPGQDIGQAGKIGHRFFFGVDEIEPVAAPERADEGGD